MLLQVENAKTQIAPPRSNAIHYCVTKVKGSASGKSQLAEHWMNSGLGEAGDW